MNTDIFGAAIKDYYQGKTDAKITVISEVFEDDFIPVDYLFRDYEEMPDLEKIALKHCVGKVLDVGAGAGSHSLYLQNEMKRPVVALDTSAGGIEVCKLRGVDQVVHQDVYNHKEKYDTILMLMNGSGIIGSLANINFFFQHIKTLLNENGQLLIDSSDLIYLYEDENGEYWVDANDGYYGEMQYTITYKKQASLPFDWLYIDYNTLQNAAHANGFNIELLKEGKHFDYLAKLTLS